MLIRRRLWLFWAHAVARRARRTGYSARGSGKGLNSYEWEKRDQTHLRLLFYCDRDLYSFTSFYDCMGYFPRSVLLKLTFETTKKGVNILLHGDRRKLCPTPPKLQINRRASRYCPIRVNIGASSHVRQEHAGFIHHRVGRRKWVQIWAVGKILTYLILISSAINEIKFELFW